MFPLLVVPFSLGQEDPVALERFYDHLKIFRQVFSVKNDPEKLSMIRELVHRAFSSIPATEIDKSTHFSFLASGITTSQEMRYSILPFEPLKPPLITERPTSHTPSKTATTPSETTDDKFLIDLENRLERDMMKTTSSSSATDNIFELPPLFSSTVNDIPFPGTTPLPVIESDLHFSSTIDDLVPTLSTKGSTKKAIAGLKSPNRIQIKPQFRHHKSNAAVKPGIYAKPKVAWYGNHLQMIQTSIRLETLSLTPTTTPPMTAAVITTTKIVSENTMTSESTTVSLHHLDRRPREDFFDYARRIYPVVKTMIEGTESQNNSTQPVNERPNSTTKSKLTKHSESSSNYFESSTLESNVSFNMPLMIDSSYKTELPFLATKKMANTETRPNPRRSSIYALFTNSAVLSSTFSLATAIIVFAFFVSFL